MPALAQQFCEDALRFSFKKNNTSRFISLLLQHKMAEALKAQWDTFFFPLSELLSCKNKNKSNRSTQLIKEEQLAFAH